MNNITERKSAMADAAAKLEEECTALAIKHLEAVRPQASEELRKELLPYMTELVGQDPELGPEALVAAGLEDLLEMPGDTDGNAEIWRVAQIIVGEVDGSADAAKLRLQLLWWSRLDALVSEYEISGATIGKARLFDGITVRDAIEHVKDPKNTIPDFCFAWITVQEGTYALGWSDSLDQAKKDLLSELDQKYSWSPVKVVDLQSGVAWTPKITIELS